MTQNLPSHWAGGRLASVKPNVILIMLGTNDINSDLARASAPARLGAYLDAILALPGVGQPTVLVANIPPIRTTAEKPAWVSAFNSEVPAIVGTRRASGQDVHFVDQFTPLNENYATLMRSDNLQPTSPKATKIKKATKDRSSFRLVVLVYERHPRLSGLWLAPRNLLFV